MSKQVIVSNFLIKLEDYEKKQASWFTELISNGRKIFQSISNSIDEDQLKNLTDSFMGFLSLLSQCHPNLLSNEENILTQSERTSKQNGSQDLLPKNDIIKMVNNDLQCPICNEWLYRVTSANCNHTFCETCIKKWLKINNTCPVCRALIQYTSTSIAVDNFISNLCQLFGGIIKERRESIQNARIEHNNTDPTVNEETTNDLSQSLENDTFISQLESTLEHSNVALLRPLTQPLQTPETRMNFRQPIVSSITPHPNTVQLSYFPQSSTVSLSLNANRLQPTSSTYVVSQHINQFQPTPSTSIVNRHTNRLQSIPRLSVHCFQPTSSLSLVRSHINRFQHTSSPPVALPTNRPQSIQRINVRSHISHKQPRISMAVANRPRPISSPSVRPHTYLQPTSTTSIVGPSDNLNTAFLST